MAENDFVPGELPIAGRITAGQPPIPFIIHTYDIRSEAVNYFDTSILLPVRGSCNVGRKLKALPGT